MGAGLLPVDENVVPVREFGTRLILCELTDYLDGNTRGIINENQKRHWPNPGKIFIDGLPRSSKLEFSGSTAAIWAAGYRLAKFIGLGDVVYFVLEAEFLISDKVSFHNEQGVITPRACLDHRCSRSTGAL